MKSKKAAIKTAIQSLPGAKLQKDSDLSIVLEYFRYTTGTTLDCMLATGVLRNSITWYADYAVKAGLLQVVKRAPDIHTKRMAGYYSADRKQWKRKPPKPLSLFNEESFDYER